MTVYGRMYYDELYGLPGSGRSSRIIEKLLPETIFLVLPHSRDWFKHRIAELRGADFLKSIRIESIEAPQDFDRFRGLRLRLTVDHAVVENWLDSGIRGDVMREVYGEFEHHMNTRFKA